MKKIFLITGARPNFMKVSPLIAEMRKYSDIFLPILVHTGQHYDYELSKIFFQELNISKPDIYLGVGSGSHAEQVGKIMIKLEKVLLKEKPDLVIVVGDVNSTLAAALTAVKLNIKVAHVEAGLRSFDREMPEEINRLLTDQIADFLFTPSPDANRNLKKEGIPQEKIYLVGNIMIDSLFHNLDKAKKSHVLKKLGLNNKNYALLTLHRPSNVDDKISFLKIVKALKVISKELPIIFPAHPRTTKQIKLFNYEHYFKIGKKVGRSGIYLIKPVGYLDFVKLMLHSKFVLTDSGGIQEETTVLNIPCLTLRNTTERPITITHGTNTLVHNDTEKIITEAKKIIDGRGKSTVNPPKYWDGKVAKRIVNILKRYVII